MISSTKKILAIANATWLVIAIIGLSFASSLIHDKRQIADLARQCCWILVSINFLVVAMAEKSRRYKAMFLNFFFAAGILRILDLIASFDFFSSVSNNAFMGHYIYQYLSCGLIPVIQLFTILYVGVALVAKKTSIVTIYSISILIVSPIALLIYYPYLENAKYLYTVEDITDFRIIDRGIREFEYREKKKPEDEHLASIVGLTRWQGDQSGIELTIREKIARVRDIRPYVDGENYLLLLFKPIHGDVSLVNLFCIGTLLCVLLFQFTVDPPQSPYIDKLLMVFLLYFSFEAFHYFVYSRTIELDSYWDKFTVSALFSLLSILLLLPILWMRLGFSTSVEGNYYHDMIESTPSHVSRWRDKIDNLVLQSLIGRLPFSRRFVIVNPKKEHKAGRKSQNHTPKNIG